MTQVDEGPESSAPPGVLTVGAPSKGELLAERYELQQHIGNDNFGRQIWRGIDVILRRPVAVVLRCPGGDAAVEMLDAAVAASRVTHPNLVDVYDAIDEGTRAYVVREWVDGGSLREYVSETPLDPDRATTVARSVASAVAAVHATGATHGNIHPGTVLIGADGRVVLSDPRVNESVTPDGDIRAVGAVLYCALTGHWPQAEAGKTSLPDAVRDAAGTVAPPRQVRGGVPGHLSDLATDLLDPTVAPPSADVLAADLSRLDTEGDDQLLVSGGPLDFGHNAFPSSGAGVPEPQRSVARKMAVGVAALLAIAIVGLLLATQFLPKSTQNQPSVQSSPTAAASHPTSAQPVQLPLKASQARIIDPPGGSRSTQQLRQAANTVDGDMNTAWVTEHYNNYSNFGRLKKGMGVLLNLGSPKSVSTVEVHFTVPGATVQLYWGSSDPGGNGATQQTDGEIVNTYKPIGNAVQANTTNVMTVPADIGQVQYLLVFVTVLPPAPDGRYQVGISEIQVFVNP